MLKKQQQTAAYEYFFRENKKQYCNSPETYLNFACAYTKPSLRFENILKYLTLVQRQSQKDIQVLSHTNN